jgi:ubiquinone/menaquinone biosynthesis C-methylase UbiE
MNEFDTKAADWDKNLMHWDRSVSIVNEIKKLIPLNKEMKAMEYGAGTGIASFLMKDYLNSIVLMDNSAEMVKIMNKKITDSGVKNMTALNFDLEHNEYKDGTFNLIFTQMVLHHVSDIEIIIKRFFGLLNPGGYLAIADLTPEDGSFHDKGFIGHNGFDTDELSGTLQRFGFSGVKSKICFTIERKNSESETKRFEVFLMTAKKE